MGWFRELGLTYRTGRAIARRSDTRRIRRRRLRLSFVVSPEAALQWASAVAVNNHFDTDGVLSVWTVLDPERRAGTT